MWVLWVLTQPLPVAEIVHIHLNCMYDSIKVCHKPRKSGPQLGVGTLQYANISFHFICINVQANFILGKPDFLVYNRSLDKGLENAVKSIL